MKILNKTQLDEWLFEHAVVQGHVCDGVYGEMQGDYANSPVALINVAYVDRVTKERFDITYEQPKAAGEGE